MRAGDSEEALGTLEAGIERAAAPSRAPREGPGAKLIRLMGAGRAESPKYLRLRPWGARGGRPVEGPGPRPGRRGTLGVGWAGRWAGGGAARAFVCAPARARPPGFPAPVALTCQELELFVWGGARPEEVVPRVWAEAAPQVGSSQTKRALTSACSWDCLPLGS